MADQRDSDGNEKVELNAEEARGGETPGIARYVLGISLAAIVIIFAIVLWVG